MLVGAISLIGYILHARISPDPLLDIGIFRDRLFRTAITGGAIFRIGIGAVPFLMPLMLQVGFGLTAFETGMVILFGALGSILAKLTTTQTYAALGFRPVLTFGAALSAAILALSAFFEPETPLYLMATVMLGSGIVRSTFFTGVNAMAFAEITDDKAGQASVISSVAQQLALALGVAVAGGILEVLSVGQIDALSVADFHFAFWCVAGIALLGAVPFALLPRDAGESVSGHVRGDRIGKKATGE